MWKFQEFSITQNLIREIHLGDFRSAEFVHFNTFRGCDIGFFMSFLTFWKAGIYQINKIQNPADGKNGRFSTSRILKIDFT